MALAMTININNALTLMPSQGAMVPWPAALLSAPTSSQLVKWKETS